MNRILVFCLITLFASSCGKKVVAPFAPSAAVAEPSKPIVSEAVKQYVMLEVVPANPVNQPAPQYVTQKSIETSLPERASSVTRKTQNESASLHVDRVLNAAPVSQFVKNASFKKLKAPVNGPRNWAPQLKIGLTLMAIGIVLAIFGLGFVGGLAALLGLVFTVFGLLVTY
jgi:hypothetical protein